MLVERNSKPRAETKRNDDARQSDCERKTGIAFDDLGVYLQPYKEQEKA